MSTVARKSVCDAKHSGDLWLLVILSTLMGFASISTDIYLPAMPALSTAFHTDAGHVQLTLSGFLVGFSLGQLLWGPIGDRYGRRMPVAIGLGLFVVGSTGCALSSTVGQLIGWRVVQAIGACAGPVLARAMVRDLYNRERSAQMLSTLMLIMGVAPLLGPILGGQILAIASWQAIFWTLVVVGALTLCGLLTLPETLSLSDRSSLSFSNVLAGYLVLARNPRFIGYAASTGLFYGGLYAYIAGSPFAFITYYHVPAADYGFLFGLNIVGMMIFNLLNTRLVVRWHSDRIFCFGAAVVAVTGIIIAVDTHFGWGGLIGLVAPLFLYVAMVGFIVANAVAGALAIVPHKAGTASALIGALQYGTGVFSAALVGWCADGTPWPMGWIVAVAGVGSFLCAMLVVRWPHRGGES